MSKFILDKVLYCLQHSATDDEIPMYPDDSLEVRYRHLSETSNSHLCEMISLRETTFIFSDLSSSSLSFLFTKMLQFHNFLTMG